MTTVATEISPAPFKAQMKRIEWSEKTGLELKYRWMAEMIIVATEISPALFKAQMKRMMRTN